MSVLIQVHLPEKRMPTREQLNNIENILVNSALGNDMLKPEDVTVAVISCKNNIAAIVIFDENVVSRFMRQDYKRKFEAAWKEICSIPILSNMKAGIFVFGEHLDLSPFSIST